MYTRHDKNVELDTKFGLTFIKAQINNLDLRKLKLEILTTTRSYKKKLSSLGIVSSSSQSQSCKMVGVQVLSGIKTS